MDCYGRQGRRERSGVDRAHTFSGTWHARGGPPRKRLSGASQAIVSRSQANTVRLHYLRGNGGCAVGHRRGTGRGTVLAAGRGFLAPLRETATQTGTCEAGPPSNASTIPHPPMDGDDDIYPSRCGPPRWPDPHVDLFTRPAPWAQSLGPVPARSSASQFHVCPFDLPPSFKLHTNSAGKGRRCSMIRET